MAKNTFSRRGFLKKSSAGAAAAALPLMLPQSIFASPAPSERIQIALIGCGAMGRFQLQGLKVNSHCHIQALCDVDQTKLAMGREVQDVGQDHCYQDFRELLENEDLDAVFIATPDHWHVLISMAAIQAGKAVYCQKPLSLCIDEGRALCRMVEDYGSILEVGSQQRSQSSFRVAAEKVRNGYIGEIRYVEVGLEPPYNNHPGLQAPMAPPPELDYNMWLGPALWEPYSWERVVHFRNNLNYSSGYLGDWGAHHLDIVQWALGMDRSGPRHISGKGVFHQQGIFNVPMDFDVLYQYAKGPEVRANITYENGIRFVGDEGWIFVSRERFDASRLSLLEDKLHPSDIHYRKSRGHEDDFFESIRTNRHPLVTAETGHRSATLCHLGNISMRLGRPLEWDPEKEIMVGDATANRMKNYAMRPPWSLKY